MVVRTVVVAALLALQVLAGVAQTCPGTAFCENEPGAPYSVAYGIGSRAYSYASFVIGRYAYAPGNPSRWEDSDTLFAAGNGVGPDFTDLSNALHLTKRGDLTISGNFSPRGLLTRNSQLNQGGLIAFGDNCRSFGDQSVAFGINTRVDGNAAVALGVGTNSQAYGSLTIGRYNVISGTSSTWVDTDPLFVAGNGVNNAGRSNALTLLKNGDLSISGSFTAPTFQVPQSVAAGVNSQAFGSQSVANASYAATFGQHTLALGDASVAFGESTTAEGHGSIAGGIGTIASAPGSLAIGQYNDPDVNSIFVIGAGSSEKRHNVFTISQHGDVLSQGVVAARRFESPDAMTTDGASAAFGGSAAYGVGSVAMGVQSTAYSYSSLAIGRFNKKPSSASTTEWKAWDVLFVAGNGKSENKPHDALRLYKNGMMYLAGLVFHFADAGYTDNTKIAALPKTGILAKLMRLEPVTVRWNDEEAEIRGEPQQPEVAILAQNMQKSFPELVFIGEDGRMGVDYSRLSVFTVQALKEQSVDLNARIASLTSQVGSLRKTVDRQQDTIENMIKLLCEHRRKNKKKKKDKKKPREFAEDITRNPQHDDDDDDDSEEHEGDMEAIVSCNKLCKF